MRRDGFDYARALDIWRNSSRLLMEKVVPRVVRLEPKLAS